MTKPSKPIVTIKINSDGVTGWKNGKPEKPSSIKQDLNDFKVKLPKERK